MSMHSSTHSSQMNTVGPAMSLRTSCWLLPQNEQYKVFLESLLPTLLILRLHRRVAAHGEPVIRPMNLTGGPLRVRSTKATPHRCALGRVRPVDPSEAR